jgi:methionyl aminopeptidase
MVPPILRQYFKRLLRLSKHNYYKLLPTIEILIQNVEALYKTLVRKGRDCVSINIKSEKEIELMRESGRILANVLEELEGMVRPGISTLDIDIKCAEIIKGYECIPSFLNYNGYPASVCISVNDEVVHGIPNKNRILKDGDIVSLDCGVIYHGFHSDAARTVAVGEITKDASD